MRVEIRPGCACLNVTIKQASGRVGQEVGRARLGPRDKGTGVVAHRITLARLVNHNPLKRDTRAPTVPAGRVVPAALIVKIAEHRHTLGPIEIAAGRLPQGRRARDAMFDCKLVARQVAVERRLDACLRAERCRRSGNRAEIRAALVVCYVPDLPIAKERATQGRRCGRGVIGASRQMHLAADRISRSRRRRVVRYAVANRAEVLDAHRIPQLGLHRACGGSGAGLDESCKRGAARCSKVAAQRCVRSNNISYDRIAVDIKTQKLASPCCRNSAKSRTTRHLKATRIVGAKLLHDCNVLGLLGVKRTNRHRACLRIVGAALDWHIPINKDRIIQRCAGRAQRDRSAA